MSDSHVVEKQQCPACAKIGKDNGRDNMAVYSDGHTHCFSCGYGSRGTRTIQNISREQPPSTTVVLPSDADQDLPELAWAFLKRFGITAIDVALNNILFSMYHNRIIFPYFSKGKLIGWQGRSLSSDPTKPKWLTRGMGGNFTHKVGNTKSHVVVLTEDIISAIRVSKNKAVCAVPLFNSHISPARMLELAKDHCVIQVWLDKDKAKESMQFAKKARDIGICAVSIITELDPKMYSDEAIKGYTNYGQSSSTD